MDPFRFPEVPDDWADAEQEKEVFARFGLTIYLAQCFEHGLVNLGMLAKLTLERHTISSRESWNRRIDDILDSSFKLTLGNIIKGLGNVVSLDMNTEMEVAEAKNQRDFLVHHFFRENTERLMTPAGRLVMLKDIEKIAGIIQSATEKVDLATGACAKHLGMTDEALETHYQSMIEQLATDDAN